MSRARELEVTRKEYWEERYLIIDIINEAIKNCGTNDLSDDNFFIAVVLGYKANGLTPLAEPDQKRLRSIVERNNYPIPHDLEDLL